ncbi:hypothetical protein BB561_000680 [Smittium simulii]|uniref:Protein farnesyltransferase/geranylgeranyltransferase type-1 subunit alpha n=1 Tax=Smittium simulii TaxID=133385 RepID=A0A2T9YY57_9FUNG|nr:hypothetical protein BB561_000680 [Smittium simulii]
MQDHDSGDEQDWISYALRADFKDLVPIFIDEEPGSICPIAYSEKFSVTMAYLRALLKTNEISKRAFELVGEAILLNPANYTACPEQELSWIESIAEDNPKNYQLWHQRQKIVAQLVETGKINMYNTKDNIEKSGFELDAYITSVTNNTIVAKEIIFLNSQIDLDSKNFHAWSYRQYIIKTFDLYDYELGFAELKISQDIRNNSAWNQKYFILTKGDSSFRIDDLKVLHKEISYSLKMISMAPNNESAWVFIIGLLRIHKPELLYTTFYDSLTALFEKNTIKSTIETSRFYWVYLYKYYNNLLTINLADANEMRVEWSENANYAVDFLANNLDPIRKNYYMYLKKKIPAIN